MPTALKLFATVALLLHLQACGWLEGPEQRMQKAQGALGSGDYTTAIELLQPLTERPEFREAAHLLLIDARLKTGDAEAAAAAIVAAQASVNPERLAESRVRLLIQQNDFTGVLKALDARSWPLDEKRAAYYRATALQALGHVPEALEIYSSLIKSDPGAESLRLRIAECHVTTGALQVAFELVKAVLAQHKDSAEAWIILASIQHAAREFEIAAQSRDRALRTAPGQLAIPEQQKLLVEIIGDRLARGERPLARAALLRLKALAPTAAATAVQEARQLIAEGETERALALLQTVAEKAPDKRLLQRMFFAALLIRESFTDAADVAASFESMPQGVPNQKALQKAISAAAAAPGSEDRALRMAEVLLSVDDAPAARSVLERAYQGRMESIVLAAALNDLDIAAGNLDAALTRSARLRAGRPDNDATQLVMDKALLAAGLAASHR